MLERALSDSDSQRPSPWPGNERASARASSRPGRRSGRPQPTISVHSSIPAREVRKRAVLATVCLAVFAFVLIATFVRNCLLGFGEKPFTPRPALERAPAQPPPG